MMSADVTPLDVEEARQAWGRICRRGSAQFDDWLVIGKVLVAARARCLKAAGTNRPFGRRYTLLMGEFLRNADLDQISKAERGWLYPVMDNLDGIMRWRASLDAVRLRQLNHPQSILCHYRRSLGIERPKVVPPKSSVRPRVNGKAIYWPQAMIRRAGAALHESRSTDCFVLARAALEAAIRTEADVVALLDARKLALLPPLKAHPQSDKLRCRAESSLINSA